MAKTKISTNDIKAISKYYSAEDKIIELNISENEKTSVIIHPSISYEDYAQLITDIIDGMFDSNGEYLPFARNASLEINLVKYFTNIKVENVKEVFKFIQNTNITEVILSTIGENLEGYIWQDIGAGVEYRKQKIYHSSKWDSVAETLSEFLDNLKTNVEASQESFKDIDINKLTDIANKLANNADKIAVNNVMNKLDEPENKESNKVIEITKN